LRAKASKSTSIQQICEQKQAKASKSEQKRAKAKSYKRSDCLYFFLSKIQTNVMDKQQIKEIAKNIHARRVRLTAATYPMIKIWLDPRHKEPAARLLRAMVENNFCLSDVRVEEICGDNTGSSRLHQQPVLSPQILSTRTSDKQKLFSTIARSNRAAGSL
jgi:hypothetical protein